MKNIVLTLVIILFAVGCSKSIQTDANGVPQIMLTARDLASPIEVFTNTAFETVLTAQQNTNGTAIVRYTTNAMPGMTSLRFQLTPSTIKELHAFHRAVDIRALNGWRGSAGGKVFVGTNVVFEDTDIRNDIATWMASGEMTLAFRSPEEAQSVADDLTKK
jgi:hypothetical protein